MTTTDSLVDETEAPRPLPRSIPSHPEQFVFLQNEVLDNLVSTVMELSAQLWVVKRRALVTERLMESKGLAARAEVETFVLSPEEEAALKAERDRFVRSVYAPFGRQAPLRPPTAPGAVFTPPDPD